MKKLFSIECNGMFLIEEENSVYSIYEWKSDLRSFYDNCGNPLPDYKLQPYDDEWDEAEYDSEFCDETALVFNKYGVVCGEGCLVDEDGNVVPDTELNLEDDCCEQNRYFTFSLATEEQLNMINKCGTAPGITVDVYDTKTRKYVAKSIPECRLKISFFDGEPEVVMAAIGLLSEFEEVEVCETGTILGKNNGWITVFNYYG